jgi:exopolysaccharide biosynthesis protein
MVETITCRAIVEVMGKPKEYVEKAINMVVSKTKEIEGLKVVKSDIAEIKQLKKDESSEIEKKIQSDVGDIFTTFAEIEFSVNKLETMSSFCFEFLPTSFEIIEPETMKVGSNDFSKVINDFLAKIHNADSVIKQLNFKNSALNNNSKLLLRNMIIISLKSKQQSLDELSKSIGIPTEQLKPFLDALIGDDFITLEKDKYNVKNFPSNI